MTEGDMQDPEEHDRPLAAPMLSFDLDRELEHLRRQPSYARREPTGRTLVREPDLRIVLMALETGAGLKEHRASGPISIQGLSGRMRVRLPGGSAEVTAGQLLALEADVPHDVEAIEAGAFLLTIGRTTYHMRDPHRSEPEPS